MYKYQLFQQGYPLTCKRCGHYHRDWVIDKGNKLRCKKCPRPKRIRAYNKETKLRRNKYSKEYYKQHPELRRKYMLKKEFGISLEEYNCLLLKQNGVCAICSKPEVLSMKGNIPVLRVDHDHTTGQVRGLLCHKCNCAIGLFTDSPKICNLASLYLRKI